MNPRKDFLRLLSKINYIRNSNDAYEKIGLESWCLFQAFLEINITLQKARVSDAYEKSEIPESFAKHHDAYKKIECIIVFHTCKIINKYKQKF